jgi:agmatine deiminase
MKSLRSVACFLLVLVFLGSQFLPCGGAPEKFIENQIAVKEIDASVTEIPRPENTIKEPSVMASLPGNEAKGINTLFFDSVESGNIGYTAGQGVGASPWSILTLGAHSATHSWDFGNGNYLDPGTGGLSYLISPGISIPSNAVSAELSFWHWRDFESNTVLYDGGNVKISTAGIGGPWTLLTPAGGYNGPAQSGYNNPLAGQMVYGYNVAWENVTFDLSAFIGSTINVRWDAGVDNYATTDAGWRIDDIRVTDNIPEAVQIPLSTGWNLISIPAVQSDTSIGAVLSSIDGQWEYAMAYNASDQNSPWESNSVYRPNSTDELWSIDHTKGIWLSVSTACTLNVAGTVPDTASIRLFAGWNLVGYPSLTPRSAIDTLPLDAVDMIAVENRTDPYRISDTGDLASVTLETGHGYWVHSTFDTFWVIVNTAQEPIRQTAEFERMQGVLIRYPLGISYSIIAEMAENDKVYTIVANTATRDEAITNYNSNHVNMANCEWIIAASNSYWTRDYGPWWITDENGDFGIVDFPYNRPRPNDDAIPGVVASYFGVPLDYMGVTHTGGNYMTDGLGISASTDLVLEENTGLTETQVKQLHRDYLGIDTYHIVPDANYHPAPPANTIKHIDCWGKYLDVDKVMIREVAPSHDNYTQIEAAAAYFENQTSAYGTPYQVYRVYTPSDEPYSNCLILNNKVLLPIMGGSNDAAAIASYQAAMPGYEVLGFTGSWLSTDALHCRAIGIPDLGMLYIQHYPVIGPEPANQAIEITANITAYSGMPLTAYELCWKLSTEPTYQVVNMSHVTRSQYRAFIPGQASGSTVQYYIHATDASGRSETSPIIGSPDPHVFTVV